MINHPHHPAARAGWYGKCLTNEIVDDSAANIAAQEQIPVDMRPLAPATADQQSEGLGWSLNAISGAKRGVRAVGTECKSCESAGLGQA